VQVVAQQRTCSASQPLCSHVIAHCVPPQLTPSLHAFSPLQSIVQLVASRHSTGFMHASLPTHDTLHGIPEGHLMPSSQARSPWQLKVHASAMHEPPAAAHRPSQAEGAAPGAGAAALVDASGGSTSATVGLSMHPASAMRRAMQRRIQTEIVTLAGIRSDAAWMRERAPRRSAAQDSSSSSSSAAGRSSPMSST
jgi:hypothetical protein